MNRTSHLNLNLILAAVLGALVCGCGMPDMEEMQALMKEQSPRETDVFSGEVLVEELEKLNLSAEQRDAVGCLLQGVRGKLAPLKKVREKLGQTVASGVAAGKIDQAKISAIKEELVSAMESARPVFKSFLSKLHCVLDSSQRQKLASAFLQRMSNSSAGGKGGCEGGCKGGCKGKGKGGKGNGLFHQLGLSKDQKMSIMFDMRDAFADAPKQGKLQKRRERVKAVAQAFKADTFDTSKLEQDVSKPQPGLDRMTRMLGIILPVLTVEQRAAFASLIKEKMAQKAKASTKLTGASCWLNATLKKCAQKTSQASQGQAKGNQGANKGGCKGNKNSQGSQAGKGKGQCKRSE